MADIDTPPDWAPKYMRDLFWDRDGINVPAVGFVWSWASAAILAIHRFATGGHFDMIEWGVGTGAIVFAYSITAAARSRGAARFRRLEARLAEVEAIGATAALQRRDSGALVRVLHNPYDPK